MGDSEPEFDNWKDAWEWNAGQAQKTYLAMSEDELLDKIAKDEDDAFYQIWVAIGQKGTAKKAPRILVDFLERRDDECYDLCRYHCIDALFKILKIKDEELVSDFQTKIAQLAQGKSKEKLKKGIEELRIYLLLK